ncbi:DUF7511 domain-containing protein [Halorussus caseinilyticus]|uniref:DUF7511 domain-containing protein n=1 Tax=Halorussus caseinilyticus TaxID=3034025 RepID=A0ABD5WLL3_9EURY|nr:hypothetical protein [Halorussus sp. DT72]
MSTDPDILDTPTDADRSDDFQTDRRAARPDIELCSVVVDYEDGPDRRTVYPDGLSSVERMSTWLTADDDAFVDLESAR